MTLLYKKSACHALISGIFMHLQTITAFSKLWYMSIADPLILTPRTGQLDKSKVSVTHSSKLISENYMHNAIKNKAILNWNQLRVTWKNQWGRKQNTTYLKFFQTENSSSFRCWLKFVDKQKCYYVIFNLVPFPAFHIIHQV